MPMQTVNRTEAVQAVHHEYNSEGKDGSSTDGEDPWNPPRPPPPPRLPMMDLKCHTQMLNNYYFEEVPDFLAKKRATRIISPDRTPQSVNSKFADIACDLKASLQKDSVPSFVRFFKCNVTSMAWGYVIHPQTLNLIIAYNALRCAKAVLAGKMPRQYRANPNYMSAMGYFPLHRAAETFSTDMIELLLHYKASANLRTKGEKVIEGLLPLHVAIENTCMHKYLEDNLFTDQKHNQANVCFVDKLIHLLCLPEMKIFLETVRLLAKHTDTVVDEIWNYIKDGKLVQTAILLLAAQQQIRNLNGFDDIKARIADAAVFLQREAHGLVSGKNCKAHKQLKEKRTFFENALQLVVIISQAGEALDAYIQTHSEVTHQDVLRSVSSILQGYGIVPIGKGIDIKDLHCCPYECPVPDGVLHQEHGNLGVAKVAMGSPNLNIEDKNGVGKKPSRGSDLEYLRNMFFPYWRSTLTAGCRIKVYPHYAPIEERRDIQYLAYISNVYRNQSKDEVHFPVHLGLLGRSPQLTSNYQYISNICRNKSKGEVHFPVHLGLLGRTPQLTSNYQSKRLFGTAAFTLLKMLKCA